MTPSIFSKRLVRIFPGVRCLEIHTLHNAFAPVVSRPTISPFWIQPLPILMPGRKLQALGHHNP